MTIDRTATMLRRSEGLAEEATVATSPAPPRGLMMEGEIDSRYRTVACMRLRLGVNNVVGKCGWKTEGRGKARLRRRF